MTTSTKEEHHQCIDTKEQMMQQKAMRKEVIEKLYKTYSITEYLSYHGR
jgi:hypothetical protein